MLALRKMYRHTLLWLAFPPRLLDTAGQKIQQNLMPEHCRVVPEVSSLTVAIPTFCREEVLLETIEHLLSLPTRAQEVLIVDQTPQHDACTTDRLSRLSEQGSIRWIRLERPRLRRL